MYCATMDDVSHDHGESAVGRMHHTSWSVNLEKPEYAENQEAIIEGALDAIEHTAAGYHVNLVTHGNQGHPSEYLYSVLEEGFDDELEWEFVEQCGCGGYVARVYV
jgi:putative CGCGG family rSAM target protein